MHPMNVVGLYKAMASYISMRHHTHNGWHEAMLAQTVSEGMELLLKGNARIATPDPTLCRDGVR